MRSNAKKCISTDSLVETSTSDLGHSKSSSRTGGISELSDQAPQSTSDESANSLVNDLNQVYIDQVTDEKMDDIDNNNEKFINHGNQSGKWKYHVKM